ncbi:MAG: hypothetical protein MJ189_04245 [Coriobacteriales bacterium]|nr:hypothetical protein [Coriobacteriales bacterium]
MDSVTSFMSQIFAPLMRLTNYWDCWFYAACLFFLLFIIFFILFIVFCSKHSKKKKLILEKDEYISGLEASLDMPPVDPNGGYLPGDSIVYITNKNKKKKVESVGQALDESLPSVTSKHNKNTGVKDNDSFADVTVNQSNYNSVPDTSNLNFNANANDIPFNSQVVAGVNSALNFGNSNYAPKNVSNNTEPNASITLTNAELTKLVTDTVVQILSEESQTGSIGQHVVSKKTNNTDSFSEDQQLNQLLDENKNIFGENTGSLSPEDIEAARILQKIKNNKPV